MGKHVKNNPAKGFAIFLCLTFGCIILPLLASEVIYDDETTSSYADTTSDSAVSPSATSYIQPPETPGLYYDDSPDDKEYPDELRDDDVYAEAYEAAAYFYGIYGDTEGLYEAMADEGYSEEVIESIIDDVLCDIYGDDYIY